MLISKKLAIKILKIISDINDDSFSDFDRQQIEGCAHELDAILKRHQTTITDSVLSIYTTFKEAILALEDVVIDQKDIKKIAQVENKPHTSALLSNIDLARQFQKRC